MINHDFDRSNPEPKDGFTLSYRVGDYCSTIEFDKDICEDVMSNIFHFLLSCGFSPRNVIDAMSSVAEDTDSAWFNFHKTMDPEISEKWGLEQESEGLKGLDTPSGQS